MSAFVSTAQILLNLPDPHAATNAFLYGTLLQLLSKYAHCVLSKFLRHVLPQSLRLSGIVILKPEN
jgi:hypothetical protein